MVKSVNDCIKELSQELMETSPGVQYHSWDDKKQYPYNYKNEREAVGAIENLFEEQYQFENKWRVERVTGYFGREGGGESISGIVKLTYLETGKEEFYNLIGYYSSWDSDQYYFNDCLQVFPITEEVTVTRTFYKDELGNVKFVGDKDK